MASRGAEVWWGGMRVKEHLCLGLAQGVMQGTSWKARGTSLRKGQCRQLEGDSRWSQSQAAFGGWPQTSLQTKCLQMPRG